MAENLIIGGGVYGAAVAFELARRGESCHLIEASHIGAGASAGPGRRGVRANGRDLRELPLMRTARNLWPTLHETLGCQPLFERTGHVLLIERKEDLAEAETRAVLQSAMGISSRLLGFDEVREFEPAVADTILAAIWCPDDGVADHSATTAAYAAAATAAGARITTGTKVTGLVTENSRVTAVETQAGARLAVEARVYILANYGVAEIIKPHVTLPVWNRAFQVIVSRPLQVQPVGHLVGHAHRILSLKAEPGNRLMISGGRLGIWDHKTGSGTASAEEVNKNLADAIAVYPQLQGLEAETADANHLESLAIDQVPIIDRIPGTDNAWFAAGWCGHGWAIAPAVARALSHWALSSVCPDALQPFSLARFR